MNLGGTVVVIPYDRNAQKYGQGLRNYFPWTSSGSDLCNTYYRFTPCD